MRKVLIIGRIPLPIGGVTVHVSRLLEQLGHRGYVHFEFCDLSRKSMLEILFKILKFNVIHIHFSNPCYQLLLAFYCKLTLKKLIITYHGNWGRYQYFGNLAVQISAKLCYVPVVQNDASFDLAKKWNFNVQRISTYIPANHPTPLSSSTADTLVSFKKHYEKIFCTNAWNLVFDKNGDELYGISQIVSSIAGNIRCALIVSDPSRKYCSFIKKSIGHIPQNVMFVAEPHDFKNILNLSDALIRNTSTDGVSLSIYEALECNVAVLASATVHRPAFCRVIHDFSRIDWLEELESARSKLDRLRKEDFLPDAVTELIKLYDQCLNARNELKSKL